MTKRTPPDPLISLSKSGDSQDPWLRSIITIAHQKTGIQFTERHDVMIESRLKRRMMELEIETYHDYYQYLMGNQATEFSLLISLLTTHHTFFFREFRHFEILSQQIIPALVKNFTTGEKGTLKIWSAACSKGHEVYSLAMYLAEHLPALAPNLDFEIFATDIDVHSVDFAQNGVYHAEELREVPAHYLNKYWTRGKAEISDFYKVRKILKEKIRFSSLNLFEMNKSTVPEVDIIFCRNVFIYFSSEQITQITDNFVKKLKPEGYLFVGLTESYSKPPKGFRSLGSSIYQRADDQKTSAPSITIQSAPSPKKVVCVDDSPSILTLLKKILTKENGFQVVGTAANGQEAVSVIQKLKPDIVTLDIHMPQMSGIEYLEKYFSSDHPPVLMISSVSTEDQTIIQKALAAGASDYVEKPSLNRFTDSTNEVLLKLKTVLDKSIATTKPQRAPLGASTPSGSIASASSALFSSQSLQGGIRILVTSEGALDKTLPIIDAWKKEGSTTGVTTWVALLGGITTTQAKSMEKLLAACPSTTKQNEKSINPNQWSCFPFSRLEELDSAHGKPNVVLVVNDASSTVLQSFAKALNHSKGFYRIIEESLVNTCPHAEEAIQVTSFAYQANAVLKIMMRFGGSKKAA